MNLQVFDGMFAVVDGESHRPWSLIKKPSNVACGGKVLIEVFGRVYVNN